MLDRLRNLFFQNKITVFLPLFFLLLLLPILLLSVKQNLDYRSKAASKNECTIYNPCRGVVQFVQKKNPKNSYYYLDEDWGGKYKLSSKTINFGNYLSTRVAVTGEVVPKVSKKGVHYKAIRVETIASDDSEPSFGAAAMEGDETTPFNQPPVGNGNIGGGFIVTPEPCPVTSQPAGPPVLPSLPPGVFIDCQCGDLSYSCWGSKTSTYKTCAECLSGKGCPAFWKQEPQF